MNILFLKHEQGIFLPILRSCSPDSCLELAGYGRDQNCDGDARFGRR